jgi:D-alanyl-D-alanine carboxypeptidase (penicillin-binding protein 5/6)
MHKIKLSISFLVIFSIIVSFTTPCFAEETTYVWSNISDAIATNSSEETTSDILDLESPSAILIEQTTGQVLYEHNCHEQLRPASVTKVMSILLIMEALDNGKITLNDSVPCSENAASMGGSQIWLDPRETLTVDEMLKAICVASANDCVVAMAEYIAGSEEAFVQMMNDKAKALGMNDTTFKNCHGLDEDGHVTSSYDIALMSRELLNNHPQITQYTTIWTDTLRDGKSELTNTNKLIRTYKGITGLKTGSTGLALYNLSASATRDNLSLIAVIMKAPSTKVRFAEATKLLDYGFNTFSFKEFGKKGEVVKTINVNKGVCSTVNAVLSDNAGTVIEKGKDKSIEQNLTLEENVSAPIISGQKLGEISFTLDGKTLSTVDIIANNDVEKLNLFTMSKKVIYSWIDLLRS